MEEPHAFDHTDYHSHIALIGGLPNWSYSSGWGYYPSGGVGLILVIVIILVLLGRI